MLSYIRVIAKLLNSEQSYKGKVKTHKYIDRQNQSTTGKLWKRNDPDIVMKYNNAYAHRYLTIPTCSIALRLYCWHQTVSISYISLCATYQYYTITWWFRYWPYWSETSCIDYNEELSTANVRVLHSLILCASAPFISSNIPAASACGVNISQLKRYSRTCAQYSDFLDRAQLTFLVLYLRGRRGRMVVGFITTYAISAYHH